ncbi:MAG: hypothetical protein DCF20_14210 [Pseudanabaena sp.]|nr:MAG: hypothetical protein DCF20_14210 [Pseudanabaena sp.]
MSVQKQVATQAIAQVPQANTAPTNNKQTAIESTPTSTPIDANTIPAIVSNPTVSIILAFAVLIRVIISPSSGKK